VAQTLTLNDHNRDLPLALLTASAGLISALIAVCLNYPIGRYAAQLRKLWGFGFIFLPGAMFGLIISSCLAFRGYLRDVWKAIVITAFFGHSYYVSIWIAGAVELYLPFGGPGNEGASVSTPALFAGGLVGAFLVVGVVSVLLNRRIPWDRCVLEGMYWSPVGGILGLLGWTLGPSLGMATWLVVQPLGVTAPTETFQNARGYTSHMYSLWIVWQTGIGILLGAILHGNRSNEVVPKPHVR
jgi:hypothetical protein